MESTFSSADFETAASATASPETTSAETTSAVDDTATPAETTPTEPAATAPVVPAGSPEKKGPIPFEVHHTALDNARTKAREEALAEWRAQHGWAEQVDRAAVEDAQRLGRLYQTDRASFWRQFTTEALADPMLRSEAARILGAKQPQPPSDPDIPIVDDKGQPVAMLGDVVKKLIAEALGKEVAPIKERIAKEDAQRTHAEEVQAMKTETDRIWGTVSKLPHFTEFQEDIGKAMEVLPASLSAAEAAYAAYVHVVIPNLSKKERAAVVSDMHKKITATTVSPSGGTTSVKVNDADRSWEDLLREEAKAAGL